MKTSNLFPSSPLSSKPKQFGLKLLGVLLLLVSIGFSATIEVKCSDVKEFNGSYSVKVSHDLEINGVPVLYFGIQNGKVTPLTFDSVSKFQKQNRSSLIINNYFAVVDGTDVNCSIVSLK